MGNTWQQKFLRANSLYPVFRCCSSLPANFEWVSFSSSCDLNLILFSSFTVIFHVKNKDNHSKIMKTQNHKEKEIKEKHKLCMLGNEKLFSPRNVKYNCFLVLTHTFLKMKRMIWLHSNTSCRLASGLHAIPLVSH